MELMPLEYEGIEYTLLKLVKAYENQNGIPETALSIRDITERTSTGIQFSIDSNPFMLTKRFALRGAFPQDGTLILIAYGTDIKYPIYIDLTEFMETEEFDLDLLLWKLEQHE